MTFCSECGQECDYTIEDGGIGSYDFWGAVFVDSRQVVLSTCCEADVFEDENLTTPFYPGPPDEDDFI